MGDWTDAEFAEKVDSEGGIFDAIYGYGLKAEMLEDQTSELAVKWRTLEDVIAHHTSLIVEIENLLDDAMEYE